MSVIHDGSICRRVTGKKKFGKNKTGKKEMEGNKEGKEVKD